MLRDIVLKDFWLKLASLAAAVLIWLTISAADRKESGAATTSPARSESRTLLDVPVVVVSSDADARNLKVNPGHVDVTVSGDAEAIRNLRGMDVHARVDVSGGESAGGAQKRVEVAVPPGIALVRVDPEFVELLGGPGK